MTWQDSWYIVCLSSLRDVFVSSWEIYFLMIFQPPKAYFHKQQQHLSSDSLCTCSCFLALLLFSPLSFASLRSLQVFEVLHLCDGVILCGTFPSSSHSHPIVLFVSRLPPPLFKPALLSGMLCLHHLYFFLFSDMMTWLVRHPPVVRSQSPPRTLPEVTPCYAIVECRDKSDSCRSISQKTAGTCGRMRWSVTQIPLCPSEHPVWLQVQAASAGSSVFRQVWWLKFRGFSCSWASH